MVAKVKGATFEKVHKPLTKWKLYWQYFLSLTEQIARICFRNSLWWCFSKSVVSAISQIKPTWWHITSLTPLLVTFCFPLSPYQVASLAWHWDCQTKWNSKSNTDWNYFFFFFFSLINCSVYMLQWKQIRHWICKKAGMGLESLDKTALWGTFCGTLGSL